MIVWGWLACAGDPGPGPTLPTTDPAPASADAGGPWVGVVGEPVVLDGSASTGASFRWTLGDGATAEGAVVEHVWTAPGHYTVDLEVTDRDGRTAVDTTVATITWPLLDDPPVAASSITGDAARVWVVMPDFDAIAVVDRATRAVSWWPTCGRPRSVALGAVVAVACEDDAVGLFDPDGTPRAEIALPWGARPFSVLVDGDRVLVGLQGAGAVAELTLDGAVVRTVPALPDLRGLARFPGGVLATRWRSPDDGGELLWLSADLGDPRVFPLAIDPGPDSDTNARGVPSLLARVVIRPDGRVAVLPGLKHNLQRGLVRDGLPLTFETTSRADLRQLVLSADEGPVGSELRTALFDDRDLAIAAAYSPLGDWLFVAHEGMETVDVLDGFTLLRSGAAESVGPGLDGLWAAPDAPELWAHARLSRELVVLDVSKVAIPQPIDRIDLLPPGGEVEDPDVLLGRVVFGRSADPRMSSAGYLSCASCHPEAEHDGRVWDFTDRGEGLRETIPLVGRRGVGHGPIHWSANFDEVQDFEHDIRGPQAGRGFLSDADFAATSPSLGPPKAGMSPELDALDAYLSTLGAVPRSPFRNPDGTLTADAERGRQIFEDPAVGCADCHPAPEYTDSAWLSPGVPLVHDVGTLTPASGQRLHGPLTGLDTPTLRGSWASGPWLHDGSAATLREVLVDHNPADLHGVTSGLSAADLDALEAFLLQLE